MSVFAGDFVQDMYRQNEIDSLRQDIQNTQAEIEAANITRESQAEFEANLRQMQQPLMNSSYAPSLPSWSPPNDTNQWQRDMLDAEERQADVAEAQAFVFQSQQLARQKQVERQAAEEKREAEAQIRAWDIEKRENEIREAKQELAKLDKALDDPQLSESGKVLIRLHRDRIEREAKLQPTRQREDFQDFAQYLDAGQEYVQRADGVILAEIKPGKYVLQTGDTMTDISIRRFGTPDRWREIYERNKSVCDTSWRPGITLIIP